jgi:tetratricopeptide (TPR) repeat protein
MNRMFLLIAIAGPCILTQYCPLGAQEKENAPPDRAATLLRKADQLVESGEILEAEAVYVEAAKVLEQQMAVKNTDAILLSWCRCRIELGETQFSALKLPEAKASLTTAMAYLQQVIPLRPKDPAFRFEFAKMHRSLGKGYLSIQRCAEAEIHQREAVELLKKLVQDYPDRADYRLELSKWHVFHSHLLEFLGRYSEAEASYKESLCLVEKLVADAPKEPEYACQLAVTYYAHAYLARESGRYADPVVMIRRSIRILSKLEADYPDRPEFWYLLPTLHRSLAQSLFYSCYETEVNTAKREAARLEAKLALNPEGARKWVTDLDKIRGSVANGDMPRLQKEMEILSKKIAKNAQSDSSEPYAQLSAALGRVYCGVQLMTRGSKDEGVKEHREGIALTQKLAEQYPDLPSLRLLHSKLLFGYIWLHRLDGDLDGDRNQGHKMILQWIATHEKFADGYPKEPEIRFPLAGQLEEVAKAFFDTREYKEASRYLKLEHEVLKKLAIDFPSCPKYRRHYAISLARYAACMNQVGSHVEADAASREGIRQRQKMITDFPGVPDHQHNLAIYYRDFGQHLGWRKNYQEAEDAFREMAQIDERLLKEIPDNTHIHFDLSRGYRSIGQMREQQNRAGDAIESYAKAATLAETAFNLNPRQRTWLTEASTSIKMRAEVHLRLGKHAEYNGDLQRLKEIDEALDTPFLRLYRIDDRAKKGGIAVAMKEADDLFHNIDLTDTQWRDLAAFYTDMAAKATDATQKESLAVRAVASLQNAVEQGCARAGLTDDARFRTLADRGDFRKLTLTK